MGQERAPIRRYPAPLIMRRIRILRQDSVAIMHHALRRPKPAPGSLAGQRLAAQAENVTFRTIAGGPADMDVC
jgi:hypothetical protein